MKLIYIAGPIDAPTAWDREQNIRTAEHIALMLMKMGAAVYCPHTQCRFYDGEMPWENWLQIDLEILKRCDAIFMIHDWKKSKGACLEHEKATEWGMPILNTAGQVADYLAGKPQ